MVIALRIDLKDRLYLLTVNNLIMDSMILISVCFPEFRLTLLQYPIFFLWVSRVCSETFGRFNLQSVDRKPGRHRACLFQSLRIACCLWCILDSPIHCNDTGMYLMILATLGYLFEVCKIY